MKVFRLAVILIALTVLTSLTASATMLEVRRPTTTSRLYCVKDGVWTRVDACNEHNECGKLENYGDLNSKIIYLNCDAQGFFETDGN